MIGEPGANVTFRMSFPARPVPKVVTDVGMVSDVIVPVCVQPFVATFVTGNPAIVDGIVTDAPEHVASQPTMVTTEVSSV